VGPDGRATVDALVTLTGFALVGGPAYADAGAARTVLAALDVPYLVTQALEFQSVEDWQADDRGLNALQATLQIAIPELEGGTNPIVFAGKSSRARGNVGGATMPVPGRVEMLAERVRASSPTGACRARAPGGGGAVRFPPNAGNVGTAAYLDVFASLFHTLRTLQAEATRWTCRPRWTRCATRS
jgi:magnesium chelatase subunit H